MKESVIAIIPVRAGSTRIKDKNIAPFAGTNLLLHKIEQLKKVPQICKIIVSSDSEIMLKMAEKAGVVAKERDKDFCGHNRIYGEVIAHVVSGIEAEHVMWAHCTNPLVFSKTYINAMEKYFETIGKTHDSLTTFERFQRYLWNDDGPINYGLGLNHAYSQNLSKLYVNTWAFSIAPRKKMIEWNYCHGSNPYKYFLDKRAAADIDDPLDMAMAKAWLDMDDSVSRLED